MANLLQDFKNFAFEKSSPLDAAYQKSNNRDDDLNRTLSVAQKMILRMLGSSVRELNLYDQAATFARGIVTVRKRTPNAVVPIPARTLFFTMTGKMFMSVENAEINESAQFIPLLVQATVPGTVDNLPPMQTWTTHLPGVTVTNASAIGGGVDAKTGDPLLLEAVFVAAKYFLQNRQFYHRVRELDVGIVQERETRRYEMELGPAVYRHIVGLISHARSTKDFMPSVD